MKTATLVVLALALYLPAFWLVAEPAFAQEVVEQPTWSVGDWWEIRQVRITVAARRDKDLYELIETPKGQVADAKNPKLRKLYMSTNGQVSRSVDPDGKVSDTLEDRKHEWVRFPLSIGTRWTFGVLGESTRRESVRYEYDCSATKWENLDIAGRPVRSLLIECQSWTRGFTERWGHTNWYAPEAKRIIKRAAHYVGGPTMEYSAWSVQP